jgi:hypothetical protein
LIAVPNYKSNRNEAIVLEGVSKRQIKLGVIIIEFINNQECRGLVAESVERSRLK